MPRQRVEPPSWWDTGLYSFLPDMPLEGWIWEFMRRGRLLTLYGNPVDAMNPNPDYDNLDISPEHYSYYKNWSWFENRKKPYYIPPSVFLKDEVWRRGFHGEQFSVFDEVASLEKCCMKFIL